MRSRPHRLAPVVALALLALSPLVAPAGAQVFDAPVEPVLHLLPSPAAGAGNFTTFPSNETDPVDMGPNLLQPVDGRMEWWWSLPWLPGNGTIDAGTTIDVVVFMGRFGFALPTFDPSAPDDTGAYRVTAALEADGLTFGAGDATVAADPTGSAGPIQEVHIAFETDQAVTLRSTAGARDASVFRLVLGVDGTATRSETTPVVFLDSRDTPSRVLVPGFPWRAYHDVESAAMALQECHERVLQQLPCDDPVPSGTRESRDPGVLGGAPGIGFLIAVVGLSVGAVLAARRIVP